MPTRFPISPFETSKSVENTMETHTYKAQLQSITTSSASPVNTHPNCASASRVCPMWQNNN